MLKKKYFLWTKNLLKVLLNTYRKLIKNLKQYTLGLLIGLLNKEECSTTNLPPPTPVTTTTSSSAKTTTTQNPVSDKI